MSRSSPGRSKQVLEGMMEGVKEEAESLTRQLQGIRQELAPGESEAQRCQSAISVASSERDLLLKRGKDAAKKLQVIFIQFFSICNDLCPWWIPHYIGTCLQIICHPSNCFIGSILHSPHLLLQQIH